MRKSLEESWEGLESAPIEHLHSILLDEFHKFRLSKTNEVTVSINGSDLSRMIASAKRNTYEKYKGLDLKKPIDKEQLLTKRYFKELGFEFPRNEEELKLYEEKFKDFPYKLEGSKIDVNEILKKIKL